jgi:hypothetical protein
VRDESDGPRLAGAGFVATLAALGCGLALVQRDLLFVAIFGAASSCTAGIVRSASIGKASTSGWSVGDYLGKEIRAQAESEGAAVKRWRETASTMGATERTGRE